MLKIFANIFWIYTPGFFQKSFSRYFSLLFELKVSRFLILPYCLFFGLGDDYLDLFESETSPSSYSSYSDFFNRKYKNTIQINSEKIWPCEGYVCDWGWFNEKNNSIVKGQKINLNHIFKSNEKMTKMHFFTNIFLHNHNYHRVHSPIQGRIVSIKNISGELVFLRPWFYNRKDVSYPAFKNERVIFEMTDEQDRAWYLAMVGGFGVGTVELAKEIYVGCYIEPGQEIAKFKLGSTVCLASPCEIKVKNDLQLVRVGEDLV